MEKELVRERSLTEAEQAKKWWRKALGSLVGAAVMILFINASTLANPDDEFITQEDLRALKEEIKTVGDEIKSIRAAKPQLAPPITGNLYSELERKITVGGEVRARFEALYTGDFSSGRNPDGREDSHTEITLLRTRLNFDADVNDYLRAYIKLQDNRAFGDEDGIFQIGETVISNFHADQGRNTGTNPAFDPRGTMGNLGRVDLLEGYLELKSLGFISDVLSDVSIQLGRWQMSYGGERVISEYDWSNQGRAWDGVRVRWSGKGDSMAVNPSPEPTVNWIDGFVTQIDEDFVDPRLGDRDEIFWGIYMHYAALEGHEIEPYFLATNQSSDMEEKELRSFSEFITTPILRENRYTAGLRLAGKPPELPNFDYELEGLFQFGNAKVFPIAPTEVSFKGRIEKNVDIDKAYAFYASAGYTFKGLSWKPRVGGGFSYASGKDEDRLDAIVGSQASGVNLGLGQVELVGWQNIIDYRVKLSAEPTSKWHLYAGFHFLYLTEEEDFWFNANGIPLAMWDGRGSKPNAQLAREFDLKAIYTLFDNFHLTLGYSHFFQGNYIKDDNVVAVDNVFKAFGGSDLDWFYIMTALSF